MKLKQTAANRSNDLFLKMLFLLGYNLDIVI